MVGLKLYGSVKVAVKGCFGEDVYIENDMKASRGDINGTRCLKLSNGRYVFIKINTVSNAGFFDAEEEGINAIADTGCIKTPALYAKGTQKEKNISFLMMENIVRGRFLPSAMYMLGSQFADMHMADASKYVNGGSFGFINDNYIGATKQINTPMDSFVDFFRICRLEPQIKMAERDLSSEDIKDIIRFLDKLPDRLIEPEKPSLLHGDMWGGNHLIDENGDPVLIDPAAYVGHAEADIAMTELFSPLSPEFYRGYREKIPMQEGYGERKDIYNLYHILNHHNLFGGGYLYSALAVIHRFM